MSKKFIEIAVNILNNCEHYVGEPLFLAGTFNNWDPQHLLVGTVPPIGQSIRCLIPHVQTGDLELKITRGNWLTLEATHDGKLKSPQVFKVQRDAEINLEIDSWRDLFPRSTASKQVLTLDDHFYFPEMNVYRKVMIYLPKDYQQSGQRYPTIYMHDGQHLFDEARSIGRSGPVEWMVDEFLDGYDSSAIVVAIDHAKDYELRQQEYLVHPVQGTKNALGWHYLEDIVQTLKPFVDSNYRTLPGPMHTSMLGSSIAGLLTLYAGLKYPAVFGTVAIFSPSIWMDEDNLYAYSENMLSKGINRAEQEFYFYMGDRERRFRLMDAHNNMKIDLDRYFEWIKNHFSGKLTRHVNPEGKHGAYYWQKAFEDFYLHWNSKINSIYINK